MCILCIEWEKQKMTSKEAFRAIGEILNTSKDSEQIKHVTDLSEKILQKEVPDSKSDTATDEAWWKHTHQED